MTFGQWFGEWFGGWFGPTERNPGAMSGAASATFSLAGTLFAPSAPGAMSGTATVTFSVAGTLSAPLPTGGSSGRRAPTNWPTSIPLGPRRDIECLLLAALALLESEDT